MQFGTVNGNCSNRGELRSQDAGIVRTWGAPFEAQGKAVLRPYNSEMGGSFAKIAGGIRKSWCG